MKSTLYALLLSIFFASMCLGAARQVGKAPEPFGPGAGGVRAGGAALAPVRAVGAPYTFTHSDPIAALRAQSDSRSTALITLYDKIGTAKQKLVLEEKAAVEEAARVAAEAKAASAAAAAKSAAASAPALEAKDGKLGSAALSTGASAGAATAAAPTASLPPAASASSAAASAASPSAASVSVSAAVASASAAPAKKAAIASGQLQPFLTQIELEAKRLTGLNVLGAFFTSAYQCVTSQDLTGISALITSKDGQISTTEGLVPVAQGDVVYGSNSRSVVFIPAPGLMAFGKRTVDLTVDTEGKLVINNGMSDTDAYKKTEADAKAAKSSDPKIVVMEDGSLVIFNIDKATIRAQIALRALLNANTFALRGDTSVRVPTSIGMAIKALDAIKDWEIVDQSTVWNYIKAQIQAIQTDLGTPYASVEAALKSISDRFDTLMAS